MAKCCRYAATHIYEIREMICQQVLLSFVLNNVKWTRFTKHIGEPVLILKIRE